MNWDKYFHILCISVSTKSPCLSRKIGAIIIRRNSIISTGYNGSPRGIPHCGEHRYELDKTLQFHFCSIEQIKTICPRKLLGYDSGEGMEWCPAQHAEANAITNAARLGHHTEGATLYLNSLIPCKNCFGAIINAGIVEIVCEDDKVYDKHTTFLIENSNIKIRRFNL